MLTAATARVLQEETVRLHRETALEDEKELRLLRRCIGAIRDKAARGHMLCQLDPREVDPEMTAAINKVVNRLRSEPWLYKVKKIELPDAEGETLGWWTLEISWEE